MKITDIFLTAILILGLTACTENESPKECVGLTHDKYNVDEKLNEFVDMGGIVLACGTCLRSRNMNGTDACPMSNMVTCVEMVAWADKMVTF